MQRQLKKAKKIDEELKRYTNGRIVGGKMEDEYNIASEIKSGDESSRETSGINILLLMFLLDIVLFFESFCTYPAYASVCNFCNRYGHLFYDA